MNDALENEIRKEAEVHSLTISSFIVNAVSEYLMAHQGTSFDTYETDDETYSRSRFYTVGSDKKGHSNRLSVRVPPGMAGEISKLVQSGVIPQYGTASDFLRDAAFHRLRDIEMMKAASGWTSRVGVERLLSDIGLVDREEELAQDYANSVRDRAMKLQRRGDVLGMEELEEMVSNAIVGLSTRNKQPLIPVLQEIRNWLKVVRPEGEPPN